MKIRAAVSREGRPAPQLEDVELGEPRDDEIRVRIEGFDRILTVSRLLTKRVAASVAAECFVDLTPPPPPRDEVAIMSQRDRGAGRPTKRDRREIERLRGR